MTREERAVACITEHRGAEWVTPKMVRAMLAFADAEAAAMRERAARVASDYWLETNSTDEECAAVAIESRILALPTTEK